MTWTPETVARHTPSLPVLTAPVRAWRIGARGRVGEPTTIPAGAAMVLGQRSTCAGLLALYGEDRGLGDFVLTDGRVVELFYSLTDAIQALPLVDVAASWCTPCRRYHAAGCPAPEETST